jgi:hypothetical protein
MPDDAERPSDFVPYPPEYPDWSPDVQKAWDEQQRAHEWPDSWPGFEDLPEAEQARWVAARDAWIRGDPADPASDVNLFKFMWLPGDIRRVRTGITPEQAREAGLARLAAFEAGEQPPPTPTIASPPLPPPPADR